MGTATRPDPPPLFNQIAAEFVGTFALVFAAVGSAVSCGSPVSSGLGLLGAALANGLVLTAGVATFGPISGAHFNPAVSVGLLAVGRITTARCAFYMLTQTAAACLAAFACRTIYPLGAIEQTRLAMCGPAPWLASPVPGVLLTEFTLTFLLMIGIYGTVIDRRGPQFAVSGSLGVGAIVAANILAGGAVSGGAMNPARAFGPALVQADFGYHWCYWLAPIAGGIAAALLYENIFLNSGQDDSLENQDDSPDS